MAYSELALGGKWGTGRYSLVDDEDYDWLSKHRCRLTKNDYVATSVWRDGDHREVCVHRLIMERHYSPLGMQIVDHVNGDRLDNRKANLRLTGHQGNARNAKSSSPRKTSRYKGVHRVGSVYAVSIMVDGVNLNLGTYASEVDAAAVYDLKARELFGEYARVNDVDVARTDESRLRLLMADRRLRNGWAARYMGVHRSGKTTWRARVRGTHLGTFDTQEAAAATVQAYLLDRGMELRSR